MFAEPVDTIFKLPTTTTKSLENRRRICVICSNSVSYNYLTSFTSVPEKQKQWLRILTNNDIELMNTLYIEISKSRKYICLDHFGSETIKYRQDETPELIRNSLPMPYEAATFQQNYHIKHQIDDHLKEKMFSVLVDAANHYIETSMKNSISHV